MGGVRVWGVLCAWCVLCACSVGEELSRLAPFGAPARFSADTSVLLGGVAAGGEVGYRLHAELAVRPLWARDSTVLLHFTLESPQLLLRGKHQNAEFVPRPSLWDARPSSWFLAVWEDGLITDTYLDSDDPPDVLNYKKSLISLFQFQLEEGERNETDVSGACRAQYEAAGELAVRKFKHECVWEGAPHGWSESEEAAEWGALEVRRAARVELSAERRALRLASADELVRGGGAKARARTDLALIAAELDAPAPSDDRDLAAALAQHAATLTRHTLALRSEDALPDETELESLESAVRSHSAALSDEEAGSAGAAAAMLRLLPALRRAAPEPLLQLLQHPDSEPTLEGLSRALGLSGAAGAHAAAREGLGLRARSPARPELAHAYWAALALAPQVDESVLRDALALGLGAGPLAPHALLAAAHAARLHPALQQEVKDRLASSLAKCKESSCRVTRLLALGHLRRADCVELLLERAESGARDEALAALAGLARLDHNQLAPARRRLERLALGLGAPLQLEVRAAALELALVVGARYPAALGPLTTALRARGPRELRRACWGRLRALAADPRHAELARLLPQLDPRPADWLRRAYDGTSTVLTYSRGALRLDSAQLASGGVLRRGAVALWAGTDHLLTIEMWTRGMESFSGGAAPPPPAARDPGEGEGEDGEGGEEGEDGEEGVQGGLALTVGGARTPDIVLFNGQGELLGHIWAGTGSEPTPLLRAVLPRPPRAALVPLHAGVLLHAHIHTGAALAQHAHAQVSLWGRTARAGTALRGAAVGTGALTVRTAWGAAAAHAHAHAEPALALAASLDFYDAPQLCVTTALDDYDTVYNVTLESSFGARAWRVRRERITRVATPGVTLALGARNHAACRALGAAHRD